MDALPPAAVYCEATKNEVQLVVTATPDEPNYVAFMSDLKYYDQRWIVVSDNTVDKKRTIVLRAPPSVSSFTVTAARENARHRGWTTQVTFEQGAC